MNYQEYEVLPQTPEPLSEYELRKVKEESWPSFKAWGCTTLFVLFLLSGILQASKMKEYEAGIVLLILVGAIAAVYYGVYDSRRKAKVVERRNEELKKRTKEAERVTLQVKEALETNEMKSKELPELLLRARESLDRAGIEFQSRAFGPFWDAIEKSARHLDEYYISVSTITNTAKIYYQRLQGREHNFPSLRVDLEELPSPSQVVDDLQAHVREAQTDFEFSTIWEHRQTRKVLIAGFEHLGDALHNIGDVISSSVLNLQEVLHSDMAEVVEQQIEAQKEARFFHKRQIEKLKELRD